MKVNRMNSVLILVGVVVAVVFARYLYIRFLKTNVDGFADADTFTLYYADWCPHCKTVKPIFADWGKKGSVNIDGKTVFVSLVEADASPDKVSAAGVKGFPTMLLHKAGGQKVEFDGERSPQGWESWLKQNL
jgi:thiol-disulfide isomerase/thioredoxin